MLCVKTENFEQLNGGAGLSEGVLNAETKHRNGIFFAKNLRNSRAETADNAVFFSGDDCAGFICRLDKNLPVNGLDGVNIDNPCVDSISFKFLCGKKSLVDHKTGCNDCYVLAVLEGNALSKLKLVILAVYPWNRKAAEAHINGAVKIGSGKNSLIGFNIICRVNDNHVRNGAHERDILAALVACAVLADGDACMGCADFYIELRICNGVSDLLKGAACGKHCKRACKNGVAHG